MNPIFITIGNIQIYWYSVILFVAFALGAILALKEAKKYDISTDFMYNLFFYLVPTVLIGARIYYVIFNLDYYSNNILSIFKVWEGGLAIHGGIIAGIIFVLYYTKKHKINTLKIIDILVVSLILGQAIGRWGNFFNGEAHGPITSLSTLHHQHLPQFIINGMYIDGNYYIPTFLYESLWCLFGFIILILIRNKTKIKLGQMTSIYMIWYGIIRFIIESMRTDSLMLGNIKMAQLISILMILIGIFTFFRFKNNIEYKSKGKENERNI